MNTQFVVVGFDGSPDARAAVRWAARAAAVAGMGLRIVHAVGLLEHAGIGVTDIHRDAAIDTAIDAGLAADQVKWCVVDGDPCSALLRLCEPPEMASLLVVGSRGSGAHRGTLLGSTSLELVERATVPVTVVPHTQRAS